MNLVLFLIYSYRNQWEYVGSVRASGQEGFGVELSILLCAEPDHKGKCKKSLRIRGLGNVKINLGGNK